MKNHEKFMIFYSAFEGRVTIALIKFKKGFHRGKKIDRGIFVAEIDDEERITIVAEGETLTFTVENVEEVS